MERNSAIDQQSTLRHIVAHDGLRLTSEVFGQAHDHQPWLLYLHGFGQNRLAWRASAQVLADQGWHGLALDARGHGESGWMASADYSLDHNVEDLRSVINHMGSKPILVGASMGGLLGMLAEGEVGALFHSLVLVDVTPRWEASGVERILDFMAAHPQGFASLDDAQAAIEAYLPHREKKDPQRLASSMRQQADGSWRWHWDPKLLESLGDKGSQYIPRLLAAASKIKPPVLLLSGSRSDVVSTQTINEFQRLVPHAEHEVIADATHMVVGDQNAAFTAAIARYLGRTVQSAHAVH